MFRFGEQTKSIAKAAAADLFLRSLSGLALRQCIELGYHRISRRFYPKENPLRLELQKRVFWCSYSMDRAAAVTLGRPFGVADEDIDVEVSFNSPRVVT